MKSKKRSVGIWVASILAILFGLLTLKSGGEVLFIDGAGREAAGNYVNYILWFNFLMGFFYIIAGIGLWLQKNWTAWLALFIASTTIIAFAILGIHVFQGGLYEQRTIGAMVLRSSVWIIISMFSSRKLIQNKKINIL